MSRQEEPKFNFDLERMKAAIESVSDVTVEDLMRQVKQEPLSDEKLEIMYSKHAFAMDKQEYMWGFRDAEKAHGIGGGE